MHDAQWIVVLFKIPCSGTLLDFKGFQFIIISVSFCDLDIELNTQDLVKFLPRHLFQDIFKMAGLSPASLGSSFIHCFVERGVFLFTATELSSCIAWFKTTENLETSIFLRWL